MADTKITYKSGVIAELDGGQTATLKCKGMMMDDDVTVESLGGGGTDERFKQLVEGTLTEINDSEITKVGAHAFYMQSTITSVNLSSATDIGEAAFQDCRKLLSVNAQNATLLQARAFEYCSALKEVKCPKLQTAYAYVFQGCSSLQKADLGSVGSLVINAFNLCKSLVAVILKKDAICSLKDTNVFKSCYHFDGTVDSTYNPDGLKDGYFYVPRKWLSDDDETMDYRRATNWTTFATQFRALEDYTVDGTTTGELDWEKVNA